MCVNSSTTTTLRPQTCDDVSPVSGNSGYYLNGVTVSLVFSYRLIGCVISFTKTEEIPRVSTGNLTVDFSFFSDGLCLMTSSSCNLTPRLSWSLSFTSRGSKVDVTTLSTLVCTISSPGRQDPVTNQDPST